MNCSQKELPFDSVVMRAPARVDVIVRSMLGDDTLMYALRVYCVMEYP